MQNWLKELSQLEGHRNDVENTGISQSCFSCFGHLQLSLGVLVHRNLVTRFQFEERNDLEWNAVSRSTD